MNVHVYLLEFLNQRDKEKERVKPSYSSDRTDLSLSTGTQPKSILHTGQQSTSSSESFSYMHFLQTGLELKIQCIKNYILNKSITLSGDKGLVKSLCPFTGSSMFLIHHQMQET